MHIKISHYVCTYYYVDIFDTDLILYSKWKNCYQQIPVCIWLIVYICTEKNHFFLSSFVITYVCTYIHIENISTLCFSELIYLHTYVSKVVIDFAARYCSTHVSIRNIVQSVIHTQTLYLYKHKKNSTQRCYYHVLFRFFSNTYVRYK